MFNALIFLVFLCREQPPSGGCVLKRTLLDELPSLNNAAAFGRLCVETAYALGKTLSIAAAAFGRLCVETFVSRNVELAMGSSRLRAAVC